NPARTFSYTANNQLSSATVSGTTENYLYDANGWRVKKGSRTTGDESFFSRGPGGELLTELLNLGTSTSRVRDYIYADGKLIAQVARAAAISDPPGQLGFPGDPGLAGPRGRSDGPSQSTGGEGPPPQAADHVKFF